MECISVPKVYGGHLSPVHIIQFLRQYEITIRNLPALDIWI